MERIAKMVAEFYDISYPKMFTRTRAGKYPYARQITMYLARKIYKVSHKEAAAFFSRDHATSVHACKVITQEMQYNKVKNRELGTMYLRIRLENKYKNFIEDSNGKLIEVCNPMIYEYKAS